ncbi:ELM2 and SANT domain-containing protein 1 [Oryzias latipes]|uniref:Mitotic deacetylase associated SANT domain protein b n=1 Tax=Oryzias latipes TaxID=8090 RepID=H2M6C8_ORYLA|nr:ELM2 and SANT domain-containing protein 1 [Oryzias latipes]XP_011488462.1 ELM2 and SANT domain-containing protein 1 [Oryzias latipes]
MRKAHLQTPPSGSQRASGGFCLERAASVHADSDFCFRFNLACRSPKTTQALGSLHFGLFMLTMSVPAQQKPNGKRTGKRITFFSDQTVAMKETSQHPDGVFYVPSGTSSDPGQSEAASTVTSNPEGPHVFLNSVIFSPDKGDQSRGHYQQTVPMKWAHQEPSQQQPSLSQQQRATTWASMPNWGQSFANYLGGLNVTEARTQNAFVKSMHETSGLPASNRASEKPAADVYRDAAKPRGMEWEQQAFQETLKPGVLNTQQQGPPHPGGSSVLQPFQLAFGQPKQHLPPYYQTFQGTRAALPNPPNYSGQNAVPSHRLEQLQKQKQMQRQQQHHVIQQQIQHHQQMQQQQIMQQQLQQQQLQHEQQQQKIQQRQQLQIQQQMQHQQLQQQNPHVLDFYSGAQNAPPELQPVVVHSQESSAPAAPKAQEPIIQDITPEPQQPSHPPQHPLQPDLPSHPQTQLQSQSQPRRSRRLSKEGGEPSDNPFLPVSSEQIKSENGALQAAPTGVIQSTRRKRRMSQEVNLEMLAQEALDRKPPSLEKESHRPWSPTNTEGMNTKCPRDDNLLPLVIPVSVPVLKQEPSSPGHDEAALAPSWTHGPANPQELGRRDHKPSVIVTRRRSLRNSLSEGSEPNDGLEGEKDDDGKKSKRRPRPDPLFIPPPKLIAPPVYSSITSYQSHLRSPVRLTDNPVTMPPYTPPPILSPVREGSGLYFSTFLSSVAASSGGLPPPATPKSATRSLLRTSSCDITPPVLSAMSEATPVSIEPRINIGSRYQAEIPELRLRSDAELDQHRAELVWAPLSALEEKPDFKQKVEDLMHLACSSVLFGGGTNQELAHHCLHQCEGDIMAALSMLLLKNPIFPRSHHLSRYHYSGSDSWTAAERRQFNKGIGTYKKDFFMVQKQVTTKTVAQCVEFYYSFKKQVKIGRSGTLVYGVSEPPESRTTAEELDLKGPHRLEPQPEEDSRKWEGSPDRKLDVCPTGVTHSLQPAENSGLVFIMKSQEHVARDQPLSRVIHPSPLNAKPRYDVTPRRSSPSAGNQVLAGQEGEFPCKKCGRVFYKVKSRSAHMKSHAEQEKKAAALRQKEAEERAAAFLAAGHQNGKQLSRTNEDFSGGEDEEDWHLEEGRRH